MDIAYIIKEEIGVESNMENNNWQEEQSKINAMRKANQTLREVMNTIKNSKESIETIWMDIKNYDVDKLKDSWTDKSESETYRTKLLETEFYVNSILTRLEGFYSVLKSISNGLEDYIGRSSEYIAYLKDRVADMEVSK